MGHVPEFGFQVVARALTVPNGVHIVVGLLDSRRVEELVLLTVDEVHRFGTGNGRRVRIVQVAFQAWQRVGKTAPLVAILPGTLYVGRHHPAYCYSCLDAVAHGGQHPRPIASHGVSQAADTGGINFRKRSNIVGGVQVIVGDDAAPAVTQFHQVTCHTHVGVGAATLFPASFAPIEGIGDKDGIALFGQIIANVLISIAFGQPLFGGLTDVVRAVEGANHLLLANQVISSVVVQQDDGWEGTFAIGNQEIGFGAGEGRQVETQFPHLVVLAFLHSHQFGLSVGGRRRW